MKMFSTLKEATEFIFSQAGEQIQLATPLGLGKPNQLLNLIYNKAKNDPQKKLTIFTALSLDIPNPQSELEKRFVEPFYKKHFGDNYPRLDYIKDLQAQKIPKNITVHEFYFQAASQLHHTEAQRNYISLNYTHVAQNIFNMEINVLVQLVARSKDGKKLSLSCNPDLSLDVYDLYKKHQKPLLVVGVVHPDLPFLGGDAEVDPDCFDAIVFSEEVQQQLFAPPKVPVGLVDHMIGFHASRLLKDDGTVQIGIGSLSDAIVHSTLLRHQHNQKYLAMIRSFEDSFSSPNGLNLEYSVFSKGLYGTSEMLMDGFMHLRRSGILNRLIMDRDEAAFRYLHGAFFLGSKEFYAWLRNLSDKDFEGLSMTRVSKVNDLYDPHELALRRQRKNARFFNTCMTLNLLGGAASETLESGQVVSGVGGQYNFVAMSAELPDSHSILMLKSTRTKKERVKSNIEWINSHLTIPRHLRDVVVTEYGIASLRGQSDDEVIKRILAITDSQFQPGLLEQAKKAGKIENSYELPEKVRNNTLKRLQDWIGNFNDDLFPRFPFGSDFDKNEENLQKALLYLKDSSALNLVRTLTKGFNSDGQSWKGELERMGFTKAENLKDKIFKNLLLGALEKSQAPH